MVQTRSGIDTALSRKELFDRLNTIISVHDSLDYNGQTDNAIKALEAIYQLTRLLPDKTELMDVFERKLLEFADRYQVRKNPVYQRIAFQVLNREIYQDY